ncbi:hypothetical protein CRUP_011719 [Coryphaenoides rupestris]|nr:hypothetical protein CRUP_011719 [Coryphaenoides rupestris]
MDVCCEQRFSSSRQSSVPETGDFLLCRGTLLHAAPSTDVVEDFLGKGTFCNVVRCSNTATNICLEFQLLHESVQDWIGRRALPLEAVKIILEQVASALSHLKSIGLIHTDLKPDNLMLANAPGQPLNIKIIDLGLA